LALSKEVQMELKKVKVESGAFVEALEWCNHRRGKNWLASISEDPRAPGGLKRVFWERGRGRFYYIIPRQLDLPLPMEWGGDYYTSRGHKDPHRTYAVLIEITKNEAVFEVCASAREAIQRAEELRGNKVLKMEVTP
jgi:hypothetical protein